MYSEIIQVPATVPTVTVRFAYGSFRLLSVRLRLESIRLRPIRQFTYVLMLSLTQINRHANIPCSKRDVCVCENIPRSKKGDHKHKYGTLTIVV